MEYSRVLFLSCILSAIFLISQANDVQEFSTRKIVPKDGKLLTPNQLGRSDKGVLYGILDTTTYVDKTILDLYLETPKLKKHVRIESALGDWVDFQLYSLGQHSVLVVLPRLSKTIKTLFVIWKKVVIADMMNNKTYDLNIPSDFHGAHIEDFIFYPDRFDLITKHKFFCNSDMNLCRVTFDLTGNKIGEPVEFFYKNLTGLHDITPSLDGGFISQTYNESSNELQIHKLDQSGNIKSSWKRTPLAIDTISNLNNQSSVCGINEIKTIDPGSGTQIPGKDSECIHYDWNTGKSVRISMSLDPNTRRLGVTNLSNGDFIVSTVTCTPNYNKCDSFKITKFNSDGGFLWRSPFSLDLKCTVSGWNFFDRQELAAMEIGNEICVSFACQNSNDEFLFQYYNRCFDKSFFNITKSAA
ncbi:hypothetical protein QAD02_009977 [Eretmocerus hayati]|uniref:Uncharacterized protein n=1 Tax=Eretmocerus hayati TaxID=131215 RepID=A0ACC2ND86_9HYME|nr:hypothetical protein QAD02_009977 [Eretmocerus hayati]